MIEIKASIEINAEPSKVWEELTSWEKHSNWIPFTKVTNENEDGSKVGAKFTGVTKFLFITLRDPMVVSKSVPPSFYTEDMGLTVEGSSLYGFQEGVLEVEKVGSQVYGKAGFQIKPQVDSLGRLTSVLTWWESVDHNQSFLKPFNFIITPVAKAMFVKVLKNMKNDLEKVSPL